MISSIHYGIDSKVFNTLPEAQVGVGIIKMTVKRDLNKEEKIFISNLRQNVVQSFMKKYSDLDYLSGNTCKTWKKVFEGFNVNDDKICCTIQNLFKRVAQQGEKILEARKLNKKEPKADLGKVISNIVDICNCVSIETETPIGVMNYINLQGDLALRYGTEGETFLALGNTKHKVESSHLVISDTKKILSWLWTFKVGQDVIVEPSEQPVVMLVCADQPSDSSGNAKLAVQKIINAVKELGGQGQFIGVLNKDNSKLKIDPSILEEKINKE